ncbi:MAG: 50S ribosomal protein L3 N(5)-glutamine methyltransferase [Porticoccaceae bacterium]
MSSHTKTIGEMLEYGQTLFEESDIYFGHGTDNAWDEVVYLLSYVLDLPPDADRSLLDNKIPLDQQNQIEALFQRRINERIPAPYITQQAWFCSLPFYVDERVIVPRSPIAELIYNQFQPWCTHEPKRVLDLCTGSGCIGIACAYAFEKAQIWLSDISEEALEVTEVNIQNHKLSHRVTAIKSDLFSGFDQSTKNSFDLIVSNPPYVDANDLAQMPDEYSHEPELALASGDDGLDFTRRLLKQAAEYLTKRGVLVVEVGNSSAALDRAFPEVPFTWLEFSEGDSGVFVLTYDQLQTYATSFN